MSISVAWRAEHRFHGLSRIQARWLHQDMRYKLSRYFVPEIPINKNDPPKSGLSLLTGSGYIHQNSDGPGGIFHYLPLGHRVISKLEAVIDKHMRSIGAAKLSLSSISTESAWRKSGRLKTAIKDGDHELFGLLDRKDSGLLLGPTHEEEITMMLTKSVFSEKPLPLRLYQVTRKYRNEVRPRAGLLRAKEFLMKDLYSFDATAEAAMKTYNETRQAYHNFFTDLGVPFLVAEADSGNMGGNLSHEYHYESPLGEDIVWKCSSCDYVANDEVVTHAPRQANESQSANIWHGITTDRKTSVFIVYPSNSDKMSQGALNDLNIESLKSIHQSIDFKVESLRERIALPKNIVIVHPSISHETLKTTISSARIPPGIVIKTELDFTSTQNDDSCPKCKTGKLSSTRTIEVGHAFYLGTRYSSIFKLLCRTESSPGGEPIQMGCYGIGVSRIMGAIAEIAKSTNQLNQSSKRPTQAIGLNWPVPIAPFKAIVIPHRGDQFYETAMKIYDTLESNGLADEVVIDDRQQELSWKLVAADQAGIPVVLVAGKKSLMDGKVEVKCKALGEEARVDAEGKELVETVLSMLSKMKNRFGDVLHKAKLDSNAV